MVSPRFAVTAFLSAVLVGVLSATPAVAEPPRLAVGEPFPTLVLPTVADGRPMSIADFRGRRVVLHVFASW